ncbi:hypothetical protein SLA2020_401890 [Shorea laevis]
MASLQCCKPAEKSCYQAQQGHSFSEKVTEVTSWTFKGHSSQNGNSQTKCYSQTQTQNTDHGMNKTQTQFCHSQTQANHANHAHSQQHASHGMVATAQSGHCLSQTHGHQKASNEMVVCHGKTKRRGHKKGMFQRIKDGVSGNSSTSSSESESDDEKCGRRKASYT